MDKGQQNGNKSDYESRSVRYWLKKLQCPWLFCIFCADVSLGVTVGSGLYIRLVGNKKNTEHQPLFQKHTVIFAKTIWARSGGCTVRRDDAVKRVCYWDSVANSMPQSESILPLLVLCCKPLTDRSHPSNPLLAAPRTPCCPPALPPPFCSTLKLPQYSIFFSSCISVSFFPFRFSYLHLLSFLFFSPSCSIY